MENKSIKPRLPGGFRDYLPDEFAQRQAVLDQVAEVYRSFGFRQLDTSAVEYFDTLAGKDESIKQIYRIFNRQPDLSGESLALRFDLTVSLARMLAMNRKEFTLPFKRYQMGEVWRGERQQKGRFKQFLQFDADIVGTKSPSADAEIVILADRTMKVLGLNNFTIKLNNRRILNGFLNSVNFIETDYQTFLRILDKLDKIGWDEIKRELEENLDLKSSVIDEISNFIIRKNDAVSYLKSNYASIPGVQEGLTEIENIMELASASGVTNLQFDLSLARGLEYYTGAVYETKLDDLPALGSVMSGGRYDNLMERFGSDPLPATGISLGVDRLLVGLQELGLVTKSSVIIKVLVIGLGEEMTNQAFKYAGILRDAGIACEVYLGENRNLKKQLDYANRSQIPYCVILGSEEISSNKAKIKEMRTGIQTECSLSGLADYFKMNT